MSKKIVKDGTEGYLSEVVINVFGDTKRGVILLNIFTEQIEDVEAAVFLFQHTAKQVLAELKMKKEVWPILKVFEESADRVNSKYDYYITIHQADHIVDMHLIEEKNKPNKDTQEVLN